jgi:hypothetical protein
VKHIQFPPIDDASVSTVGPAQTSSSARGLFSRFFEALHESRRLQAARVIHQHRHLIDRAHKADAAQTTVVPSPKQVPRIVPGTANCTGKRGATMSFTAKLIMAIVLAGFVVLHFIAEGALRHASGVQSTEDNMPLANRD